MIAGHVDEQPCRDGVEREESAKVVHAGIALGCTGGGNPRSRPLPREQGRVHHWPHGLSRGNRRRGQRDERHRRENARGAHRSAAERVAGVGAAALEPAPEPLDPLRGGSMRERLGIHGAPTLTLEAIVPDG